MNLTYVKYRDEEGNWFCPIDSKTGEICNAVRYDAEAFMRMWKPGVTFIPSVDFMGKGYLRSPELVKGSALYGAPGEPDEDES